MPRPADLTPADTSSYIHPSLAAALRHYHAQVDEFLIPLNPPDADVSALVGQMSGYDLALAERMREAGCMPLFVEPPSEQLPRK